MEICQNGVHCCCPMDDRHKLYEISVQNIDQVKQLIDAECIINERNELILLNEFSRLHLTNKKPGLLKSTKQQLYLSVYKIIWAGLRLPFGNHLKSAKEKKICPCYMFVMVPSPVDEHTTSLDRFNLWRFYLCTINNEFIPIAPIHWQSILHTQRFEIERYRKIIYSKNYSKKHSITEIPLAIQVVENGYYLPTVAILAGFSKKITTRLKEIGEKEIGQKEIGEKEIGRSFFELTYMNSALTVFPPQDFIVFGPKPNLTKNDDHFKPYPASKKGKGKGRGRKKALPEQANKLTFAHSKSVNRMTTKAHEELIDPNFDVNSFSNIKPLQQKGNKSTIITQTTISSFTKQQQKKVEDEEEDEGSLVISDNENEIVADSQSSIVEQTENDTVTIIEDGVVEDSQSSIVEQPENDAVTIIEDVTVEDSQSSIEEQTENDAVTIIEDDITVCGEDQITVVEELTTVGMR